MTLTFINASQQYIDANPELLNTETITQTSYVILGSSAAAALAISVVSFTGEEKQE